MKKEPVLVHMHKNFIFHVIQNQATDSCYTESSNRFMLYRTKQQIHVIQNQARYQYFFPTFLSWVCKLVLYPCDGIDVGTKLSLKVIGGKVNVTEQEPVLWVHYLLTQAWKQWGYLMCIK